MTPPGESDINLSRPEDQLAAWLTLAAFIAYWWFMLRATRSLVRSLGELGQWFRDWRAEGAR